MSEIEKKLKRLGYLLPEAPKPMGNFDPFLIDGASLYISGQVSICLDGTVLQGKLGETADVEKGQKAAQYCALNIIARAKAALTDLNRIERLVKLGGFVNSSPDFTSHPKVINGASDLMINILGEEKGKHVRFAVGCASLPSNACIEIEAVFRIYN
jgi:enamine deaminase RidA (YjgF/YER057c/UK114 family)